MVKVGINGFGRIGRLILRALLENYKGKIQVVGINDLGSIEANAHLIKFDSTHGILNHEVKTTKEGFQIGDQKLLDTLHKDLRRARASGDAMIPTSTGAAKAMSLVLPSLKGKLDGTAIRVPTPNVSLIDLTFVPNKEVTIQSINDAMSKAAQGSLKGILATNSSPLVSKDFNHNPHSSIFDLTQTQVIKGKFSRVLSWYDNEWGFSNRMCDTAIQIAGLI